MSQETIEQITADVRAAFQKAIAAEDLSPADAVHVLSSLLVEALDAAIHGEAACALPDTAPELWENRIGRKENPITFTKRVYAPWIGKGLQRSHLLTLDKTLYSALGVWLHRHPEDCALLPSRSAPHIELACTAGDLARLKQSLETLQDRRRKLARLSHP
jgi:hypothetical protein